MQRSGKSLRFAIPRGGFFERLDPEVARLTDAALATMSGLGARVKDQIDVPLYWEILQGIYMESLDSLCEQVDVTHRMFKGDRPASASQECRSGVDHAGIRRLLQETRQKSAELFTNDIDLLVLPTWKRLPMTVEERRKTWPLPKEVFMQELWNCLPFNVLGLPAISVPCGFTKGGLPVGIQIVGRPFAEDRVLAFAHAYEQAARWHLRKPAL